MRKSLFARWQTNFITGLAVVLPGAISVLLVVWVVRNLSFVTDVLLVFLPKHWTHQDGGKGPLFWYSSWLAFLMAVGGVTGAGLLARIYIGQRIIQFADQVLLQVPLINKIYSAIKQVNEAFTSNSKSSFKQVVLVEYPRVGLYTVGFVTNDRPELVAVGLPERLVCVFIPTTPNPTSGFIILVPAASLIKVDMPVAEGIKFVISLGSLSPDQQQARIVPLKT
jgi:uncharacterized membrane protein